MFSLPPRKFVTFSGMVFDMRSFLNNGGGQRGSALIVALFILLMVSVLGISAMRTSIYSAKVATGVQADTMTFDAAESVVSKSFTHLGGLTEQALSLGVLNGGSITSCLGSSGELSVGGCGESDRMDSRGLLQAESYIGHVKNNCRMVSGSDVELYRDYVIDILAQSKMESYQIENNHLQEALKIGLDCIQL